MPTLLCCDAINDEQAAFTVEHRYGQDEPRGTYMIAMPHRRCTAAPTDAPRTILRSFFSTAIMTRTLAWREHGVVELPFCTLIARFDT